MDTEHIRWELETLLREADAEQEHLNVIIREVSDHLADIALAPLPRAGRTRSRPAAPAWSPALNDSLPVRDGAG